MLITQMRGLLDNLKGLLNNEIIGDTRALSDLAN